MIENSNRRATNACAGRVGRGCRYVCAAGYVAHGEHVCQPDGVFRGGECRPEACTAGVVVPDSDRDASNPCSGSTDDICEYTCGEGFYASGVHRCRASNAFYGGRCVPRICVHGLRIDNSDKVSGDDTLSICCVLHAVPRAFVAEDKACDSSMCPRAGRTNNSDLLGPGLGKRCDPGVEQGLLPLFGQQPELRLHLWGEPGGGDGDLPGGRRPAVLGGRGDR